MAETPSPPASTPSTAETDSSNPAIPAAAVAQYWCYHCDKRVAVETLADQPDVICNECKFGFVESLPPVAAAVSPPPVIQSSDEPPLGIQFLQVLRLLAQVAREEDAPPPPPPPPPPRPLNPSDPSPPSDDDFLRIEIDGWDHHNEDDEDENNDVDDEDDDDEEEEEVRSVEIEGHSDEEEEEEEEEVRRRQRRDVLRLRLRDFANRARSEGRNRILDWAEILMGLDDNSIEFRFEMPSDTATDGYIGNPGDYVDAAEYEALLQNLADAEGRRGAPPAAKSAVESLRMVEIRSEEEGYVCAICKDAVNVGEFVKEMPCGHGYHGDCIVPWLAARNSCPVCRFELPTDDPDYEEERKKRSGAGVGASSTSSV